MDNGNYGHSSGWKVAGKNDLFEGKFDLAPAPVSLFGPSGDYPRRRPHWQVQRRDCPLSTRIPPPDSERRPNVCPKAELSWSSVTTRYPPGIELLGSRSDSVKSLTRTAVFASYLPEPCPCRSWFLGSDSERVVPRTACSRDRQRVVTMPPRVSAKGPLADC
jgi:hypothetical protein